MDEKEIQILRIDRAIGYTQRIINEYESFLKDLGAKSIQSDLDRMITEQNLQFFKVELNHLLTKKEKLTEVDFIERHF